MSFEGLFEETLNSPTKISSSAFVEKTRYNIANKVLIASVLALEFY
ncbi:hypothetical protein [Sediminibacillus massiliensis]|nr:hypothetical protein [Sediminibacillus massiliensis]